MVMRKKTKFRFGVTVLLHSAFLFGWSDSHAVESICLSTSDLAFIHDVQGSGLVSPLVGSTVIIEGIVVGDFQDDVGENGDLNGFFVQEEDADADADLRTSEGIFVFQGSDPAINVANGDRVRVTGRVDEFNNLTELTNVTQLMICATDAGLPTPAEVMLPIIDISDLEAFEGMSIRLPQRLTITEYFNFDRFGEVVLATDRLFQPTALHAPGSSGAASLASMNALSRITIDDGRTAQNPDPARHPNGNTFDLNNRFRGGDWVDNMVGVMDYRFDLYRVHPTGAAGFLENNLRPSAADPVGGTLRVASLNVLNYFSTVDNPGSFCGPSLNQGCRGADDETERVRQLAKIVSAIEEMDAHIVGLIEVENSPGDQALSDIVEALNNVLGAGTYEFVNAGNDGVTGPDTIKVALIYQPVDVLLVGDAVILDDMDFLSPNVFDIPKNRAALTQSFMDSNSGGIFTVAVNHFKSKGSGCGQGDDDAEAGNCNLTRTLAAQKLVDWLATDPTNSGDNDILILGDLNAYAKEDPIVEILAGPDGAVDTVDDYTNLAALYAGESAYSFVFDGQLGYLDHALANADLAKQITGATFWHINADEPDILDYDTSFKKPAQDALYEANAFRSSDHDPIIVGLDVCDEIAPDFELALSHDTLWPPNHKYVQVSASAQISDNFDNNPMLSLLSVTSNEADNGPADGNTVNDIKKINETTIKLRAERSGIGSGRVYTITYVAEDACGNSTTRSATVTVPINR